jgi:hypothetical protein
MIKTRIFGVRSHQKPNCSGGVVALLDGVAFGREFGQKGPERGWCRWREAVFLTKVDVKPGPFMIVLMEGLGHVRLVQAPLETSSQLWRELLHCNGVASMAARDRPYVWIVG